MTYPLRIAVPLPLQTQVQHFGPMRLFLRPWTMGQKFLWETRKGVLNYVIVRPLMSLLTIYFESQHKYCEGQLAPGCAWPFIAMINSFSQVDAYLELQRK